MKKKRINWKKILTITLDILLAAYLVIAVTAFNKPDESRQECTGIDITIMDGSANGFISKTEIEKRLKEAHLYPKGKQMEMVNVRDMEETLMKSPFVEKAECYKTQDGHVSISISQRLPVIRIKAANGFDAYLDDQDNVMPNSQYTSDLIIATGNISKDFATEYISPLAKALMENPLWRDLVEQINVTNDHGIEIIPRVGDHVVYLGRMPENPDKTERQREITAFVNKKLERLMKFYQYGLSQAGWNKYSSVNLEFDNQIICKQRKEKENIVEPAQNIFYDDSTTSDNLSQKQLADSSNNSKKEI